MTDPLFLDFKRVTRKPYNNRSGPVDDGTLTSNGWPADNPAIIGSDCISL